MLRLSRFLIPESSKHCWKEMVWEMLKKEITIKQGTEDARLEGLQQDNAEKTRDHGMKLGFWKLRETENHRGHDRPICDKRRGSGLRPETAYKIFCFAEDDWVSLALIFWVTED